MRLRNVKFIEGGVDYLRATAKKGTASEELLELGLSLIKREVDFLGICEGACKLGYDGLKCNNVFVGERPDGVMLQISSRVEDWILNAVNWDEATCTRIDVQFVIATPEYNQLYGEKEMIYAEANRNDGREKKNWPKIKRFDGRGEGDTIMVGSRESEGFGRIYDKDMESGNARYKSCWRYEVEYKGSKARNAIRLLRPHQFRQDFAVALCSTQYEEWGFDVPPVSINAIELPSRDLRESDIATKLQWLKKQVRPTVELLADEGFGRDALDALFAGVLANLYGEGYNGVIDDISRDFGKRS